MKRRVSIYIGSQTSMPITSDAMTLRSQESEEREGSEITTESLEASLMCAYFATGACVDRPTVHVQPRKM